MCLTKMSSKDIYYKTARHHLLFSTMISIPTHKYMDYVVCVAQCGEHDALMELQ